MSTSEERSHEPPYKPQIAPPQCRRGGSQSRGATRHSKQSQSYRSQGNERGLRRNLSGGRPQNSSQSGNSCGKYSSANLGSERISGYG